MRARSLLFLASAAAVVAGGCEDGPEQVFTPNAGNPLQQNGIDKGPAWVEPGDKQFANTSEDTDKEGRAVFCGEAEQSKLIEQMVVAPIIPDSKVGTLPLWGEGGVPLLADDLFGLPSEGKFCQPTATYSDALVWGPTNEIIVWINEDTRLVEGIMAYSSYLGAMKGKFKEGANDVEVVIQPRNKIRIGGAELDEYASRAEASGKPRAWLNTKNVTKIYRSLRETFFGDAPKPADFDCVEQALCDIIFTNSDETVPQDTFIDIQDTGIQLRMAPDGSILFVYAGPVKVAPFEVAGNLGFASGAKPDPRYDSVSLSGCNVGLNDNLTWKTFKQSCIDSERTMNRIAFNVSDSRDSVAVDFNGITLNFMRPKERGVLKDGEAPADDDKLYALTYTRSLSAKTNEFVAMDLAQRYKAKLQARLKQSLLAQCSAPPAPVPPGADDPCQHPFADYQLEIPDSLATEKQRIGELMYMSASGPASWIPAVIKGVQAKYDTLSHPQKAMVSDQVLDPVYLIEPFVEAVIDAYSHDNTAQSSALKFFRTTDNRRWSIGYGNFISEGVPYRITVQYSLNFGAVTAVTFSRGFSQLDEIINGINDKVRGALGAPPYPYYAVGLSQEVINSDGEVNPYAIAGTGVKVTAFDRKFDTLEVTLATSTGGEEKFTLPGDPIQDRNGFNRQLRGERFEFIPANVVRVYGKETQLVLYVGEAGEIERVDYPHFKGGLALCDGLSIRFGYDIPSLLDAYKDAVGQAKFQECDIAFNYSDNGNVLNSVVSLKKKVGFVTVAGRATTAYLWR